MNRRISRVFPLIGISAIEMTVAFVRMMILAHILGPFELGFAAALSATYAIAEQSTDIAIYRFVMSTPRSEYPKAVAAAHALALVRGAVVAAFLVTAAYPASCILATCKDWSSFALLAPIILIRSFENLEIKVGERDYRFKPQLVALAVSQAFGLVALALVAYETQSHFAFVAYLLTQSLTYTLATHLLAACQYRADLNQKHLRKAAAFGLPLIVNGAGLAIIAQGDRLVVGAWLGLPMLAHYAILVLSGLVPLSGIFRIVGTINIAGLQNAERRSPRYLARTQLFARAAPMIAGCYALFVICFLNPIVARVFGAQYIGSPLQMSLIALIAFLRIIRTEPHASLLLNAHQTTRLAAANLSLAVGLPTAIALLWLYPKIDSVLLGGAVGEAVSLIVMIAMSRRLLGSAIYEYLISVTTMLTIVSVAASWMISEAYGFLPQDRWLLAAAIFAIIAVGGAAFLLAPYRRAYGAANLS